ncbi:transporter substrate-binding domain-containing protein [Methylopila henanensis]|uniref:Transporter substrate-binding domain-containing protein n=1 Tax=Methylopila henanensis TaxID=873516 RepID=A0ABW4KAC0_9HYPH
MAIPFRHRYAALAAGLLVVAAAAPAAVTATRSPAVASGGPLRIGVTTTAEAAGERVYLPEGFEAEIAEALAARLKVPFELVRVEPERKAEALDAGRVDVLLDRLPADVRETGDAPIVRTGYASGQRVAMRTDTTVRAWADLKGRTVCVSRDNLDGQRLAREIGANTRLSSAPAPALIDVRTGACDASIHDAALLAPLLEKRIWRKFSATLPETARTELAIVVSPRAAQFVEWIAEAAAGVADAPGWRDRAGKWASTVDFEVYRDQVAADCH